MGKLRELKSIYLCELIRLLRDRHTIIYSVAVPIFLYPLLLVCLFQSMAIIKGWTERQISRVHVHAEDDQQNTLLLHLLGSNPRIELVRLADLPPGSPTSPGELVRTERIDAGLVLRDTDGKDGVLDVEIVYSSVVQSSASARQRLEAVLVDLEDKLLLRKAHDIGEGKEFLAVLEVSEKDVASGEKKANFVLSRTLPLVLIVIILMGAFYPALDATAGERERKTLETTLVTPVPRSSLVVGKYLAVVTLALVAFLLNFLSMTFSFRHLFVQVRLDTLRISISSLVIIVVAALLLTTLLSALMMAVAYLARTFKEGQSYMTPIYLIGTIPVAITLAPDVQLDAMLAAVPVVNVMLVFRDVLQSQFEWKMILISLGFSGLYTALAITLAVTIVSRESFLLGERRSSRRRTAGANGARRGQ